jgi:cysteine-rich repeat protein
MNVPNSDRRFVPDHSARRRSDTCYRAVALTILAVVLFPHVGRAQCSNTLGATMQVTDLADGLTAANLAAALVGDGVAISNVTFTGSSSAAGAFTDSASVAGLGSGVILSSGCVKGVAGPNDTDEASTELGQPGDASLDSLIPGSSTNDATVLEFDFVPNTDTIQARYVFSSEEYNEFVNSGYNDVFGLFVNGTNYARLPDATTVVSIDNVNGGNPLGTNAANPSFFRSNDPSDTTPLLDIEPDGLTVVLEVTAPVVPDTINHFKIAIADAGDSSLDSWILIEAGSLSATENCSNGIDDDGDDLVDGLDPNCQYCGSGSVDPGEQCDDGNVAAEDGCSPDCQFEDACGELENGTPCGDLCSGIGSCQAGLCIGAIPVVCNDNTPCTADSCDPDTGLCVFSAAPATGCLGAGNSGLQFGTANGGKARWRWQQGEESTCEDFGQPDQTTDYDLCVYDTIGPDQYVLAGSFHLPASSFWSSKSECDWLYRDKTRSADGISKFGLAPDVTGKAAIKMGASGTGTPVPVPVSFDRFLTMNPSVTVQLFNGSARCWESVFTDSYKNTGAKFKTAKKIIITP